MPPPVRAESRACALREGSSRKEGPGLGLSTCLPVRKHHTLRVAVSAISTQPWGSPLGGAEAVAVGPGGGGRTGRAGSRRGYSSSPGRFFRVWPPAWKSLGVPALRPQRGAVAGYELDASGR